jgi:RNA polymerase sigma factor (sigma-70 family)
MDQADLVERFETQRPRLRAVAYRMLGSFAEADDAVQEAWIRLNRSDAGEIDNMDGWLTAVVGRVCLNMLRSRTRRAEPLDTYVPDPIVRPAPGVAEAASADPEQEAILADSVGLALLVVLDTLDPAERLAFVLHDMFALPFDDIAPLVGRSTEAARQLASRARRRVRGATPGPEDTPTRQREVVNAFLAASRGGDFDALVAVLDPDISLRADYGPGRLGRLVRGAHEVASNALMFSQYAPTARLVLVNGEIGVAAVMDGTLRSVLSFTVRGGLITEINILSDPERLARLEVTFDECG